MRYYLGVDIGTFESKGVLVNEEGTIVASSSRAHKMLVPQAGWAEHRALEDWWGDFTFITQKLLAESRIDPKSIRAVGASGIGPCMLPVGADGNPLMPCFMVWTPARRKRLMNSMRRSVRNAS
jgi:xylulokinase